LSEDPFAELRAEYRASLPPRLERIESLLASLVAGEVAAAQRRELERELHSIAGSGRTFGLPAVSAAARAAEALLEQPGEPDWSRIRDLLAQLRAAL
jgi:HPt (histidine-containing phosphotransfer) domain-containing protein